MPLALGRADERTLIVQASGDVTYEDVQRLIGEVARVVDGSPGARILVDNRQVTSVPSTAELKAIAAALKPLIASGVTGFAIVTGSAFLYGIGRMFGAFADVAGAKVAVFRDLEGATAWLDGLD
jgi:hypothetical protein